MPLPPGIPSTERSLVRERQRGASLERRFPAVRFLPVVFDGLGNELSVGIKGDVPVHFDAILTGWRLLADQIGSIQIDIWKSDYAAFPPTVTDTIVGTSAPTLAGTDKAEALSLAGDWTTQFSNGDNLRFHIDSVATVTRVTLTLILAA